ncbi:MAG: hypothetical protein NT027_18515, partial [Proteobacteria bacterium]|nr:hypothetical protein [Pseudomonadota bacterium]
MKCRYSSSTIHAWLFLTTMMLLLSGESFARFNHRDASRIDDDSALNTESYNDEFSYRYPAAWIDQWNESSMGYRASAGSLSATRFIFTQNIKLDPNPLADFSLAFFSDRKEDYSEIVDQNELRFGMKVINELRLFVLADTASDKEYSDL